MALSVCVSREITLDAGRVLLFTELSAPALSVPTNNAQTLRRMYWIRPKSYLLLAPEIFLDVCLISPI